MKNYETSQFRVNDHGISLLRSKYAYKNISFLEIDEIRIKKGSVVRNPLIVLLMGLILVFAGLFLLINFNPIKITDTFIGIKGGKAIGYLLFMAFGLFSFGGLIIYQTLKRDIVLEVIASSFESSFPLTELRKRNEIQGFIQVMKEKASSKIIISI